jgi:hypothetical protein
MGKARRDRYRGWVRQYVIGLGIGGVSVLYGLIALWTHHTFLPGLKGGNATVSGAHGAGLALAYTVGGLYLLCRFFLHRRFRSEARRAQLYLVENVLLLVLIASLGYVLWQVGTVG